MLQWASAPMRPHACLSQAAHMPHARAHPHALPPQAEACGLHPSTPLLQVLQDGMEKGEVPSTAGSPFPLPKHGDAVVKFSTMPLDHANYAVMWGAMSAGMGVLALRLLRRGK